MDQETILNTERNRFMASSWTSTSLRTRGRSGSSSMMAFMSRRESGTGRVSCATPEGTAGSANSEALVQVTDDAGPSSSTQSPTATAAVSAEGAVENRGSFLLPHRQHILHRTQSLPTTGHTRRSSLGSEAQIAAWLWPKPEADNAVIHSSAQSQDLPSMQTLKRQYMQTGSVDSGLADSRPTSAEPGIALASEPQERRQRRVCFDPLIIGRDLRLILQQLMEPGLSAARRQALEASLCETQRELDDAVSEARSRSSCCGSPVSSRPGGSECGSDLEDDAAMLASLVDEDAEDDEDEEEEDEADGGDAGDSDTDSLQGHPIYRLENQMHCAQTASLVAATPDFVV